MSKYQEYLAAYRQFRLNPTVEFWRDMTPAEECALVSWASSLSDDETFGKNEIVMEPNRIAKMSKWVLVKKTDADIF